MGGGTRLTDKDWELVSTAEAAALPNDHLDDEARARLAHQIHRLLWNQAMRHKSVRQIPPRDPPIPSPSPPAAASCKPSPHSRPNATTRSSLVAIGLALMLALGLILARVPTPQKNAQLDAAAWLSRRPHAALIAGGRQHRDGRTIPSPAPINEPQCTPAESTPTDDEGLVALHHDLNEATSGARARMVLSTALGMAGLVVGVPWVPGLTDNVLVGLGMAMLPTETFQEWTTDPSVPLRQTTKVIEGAAKGAAGQWSRLAKVARCRLFGRAAPIHPLAAAPELPEP